MSVHSISFVGAGNVATHLALAVKAAGFEVRDVFSLHKKHADTLALRVGARPVGLLQDLDREADLIILAIPDKTIELVAHALPSTKSIIAHTSGITPLEVLRHLPRYGVFYPLQTFSKDRDPDVSGVPFCLEAGSEEVMTGLTEVAEKLSASVYRINSEQRKYLHLAAVLVNNYTNYLYRMAFDILDEKQIDTALLMPLIEETFAKIREMHPHKAQTGPARRKDLPTIEKHLSLLEEFPEYKELYSIFAEQIIKKYHE
jgi:predicted short-subunit dehydrogenase-like oxidoreductase (DUF2520 family)